MKKKIIFLVTALSITIGCVMGGTLAWLTDRTQEVVNTFTVGNIDIELDETTTDYKMIPGCDIEKDPIVTVKKESEACWLFVKVVEAGGEVTVTENGEPVKKSFDSFITYKVEKGWELLNEENGNFVYYREVEALTEDGDTDQSYSVIGYEENGIWIENKVLVNDTVTKEMMDELEKNPDQRPTLTFTAYAVQKAGFTTAAEAWAEVNQ